MLAAVLSRRFLITASALSYAAIFLAFLFFARPTLGVGHFYYLSIALLALATGPRAGAVGGLLATALYAIGVAVNPHMPSSDVPTSGMAVRIVTYTSIGVLLGWYAQKNRELVQRLRVLAERDSLTGLPNTRAFEAAITRRLDDAQPFALLLGDMDRLKLVNGDLGREGGNDALQRLANLLGNSLGPEDELARVGGDEFAVLTSSRTTDAAAHICARLETVLAAAGLKITFGWAVHPQDGANALSLYRAADERLYARKLIRTPREELASLTALPR